MPGNLSDILQASGRLLLDKSLTPFLRHSPSPFLYNTEREEERKGSDPVEASLFITALADSA